MRRLVVTCGLVSAACLGSTYLAEAVDRAGADLGKKASGEPADTRDVSKFIAPGTYTNPRTMLEDYGRQVVGFAGPEANPSRGPAVATADVARPVYAVAEAPWLTTENTLAVATDEATGVPQLVAKVLFAGPGATPERVRQLLADFEQSLSKPGEYQLVLEPGLDHFIYVDPANGRPFMNFGTRGERFMSLPSYLREPPGPDGKGGVPGAPQDHDWTDWAALHEGLHLFYGIPDAYVNWASRPWFAPLGYMTVDGYEDQMNGNRGAYGLPSLAEILHQNQAPRFRRGY